MSQRDRVLDALRSAGGHGVTQVDFLLPGVIDGGAPITRVGARVQELRDAGYAITSVTRRQSCAVYVLVREPHEEVEEAPAALFEAPAPTPLSPYDMDAAA